MHATLIRGSIGLLPGDRRVSVALVRGWHYAVNGQLVMQPTSGGARNASLPQHMPATHALRENRIGNVYTTNDHKRAMAITEMLHTETPGYAQPLLRHQALMLFCDTDPVCGSTTRKSASAITAARLSGNCAAYDAARAELRLSDTDGETPVKPSTKKRLRKRSGSCGKRTKMKKEENVNQAPPMPNILWPLCPPDSNHPMATVPTT